MKTKTNSISTFSLKPKLFLFCLLMAGQAHALWPFDSKRKAAEKAAAAEAAQQRELPQGYPQSPSRSSASKSTTQSRSNREQAEAMIQNKIASKKPTKQETKAFDSLQLPDFISGDIPTVTGDDDLTNLGEDFFAGLSLHHLNNNISFKGFKLNSIIGDTTNLSTLQGALYTGAIAYFAEHPAFGGDRNRGYHPEIWPALVRVALENRIIMLPSGELLYPSNPALKFMIVGKSVPLEKQRNIPVGYRVLRKDAHIAVTDMNGHIMGENFFPINTGAVVNAYGEAVSTTNRWKHIQNNSAGLQAFRNGGHIFVSPTPETAEADEEIYEDNQLRNQAIDELNERTSLAECFGYYLKLKFKAARECFYERKEEAMFRELTGADDYNSLDDFRIAATRGAIAGGAFTTLVGGMDLGTGIGLGALVTTMQTAYNSLLKKETITDAQVRSLMTFINRYTFAPGKDGIIDPGTESSWMVYENGVIVRYQETATFKDNGANDGESLTQSQDIPIDLYGQPRSANIAYRIKDNVAEVKSFGRSVSPEEQQRQMESIANMDILSGAKKRTTGSSAPSPAAPAVNPNDQLNQIIPSAAAPMPAPEASNSFDRMKQPNPLLPVPPMPETEGPEASPAAAMPKKPTAKVTVPKIPGEYVETPEN